MTTKSSLLLTLLFTGSLSLLGCSANVGFPSVEAAPSADISGTFSGRIHGGQQPIAGAKIYMLAAGTTGYGSAATSLLTATSPAAYPTQKDGNGFYYATTDAQGRFQLTDTCTAGQQVYLASVGGVPGGYATNSAANEIVILGACPAAGNFDALAGAYISEISTVAAAFAAGAYAVDTMHIGAPSSTTLEKTGIANAFANAANLYDPTNIADVALTKTPGGNGTVPQAKIQTLANVLASCVNSSGPSSPACSTLFANTKSAGASGTTPSDVTAAAINIAHNPWANVSTLFTLQTANAPFGPALSSAPNDYTVGVSYSNAALGNNPYLALDSKGDLWTVAPGGTAVSKLSPAGVLLSGASGFAIGGGFANARGLAVDTGDNVYIVGKSATTLPGATGARMTNAGVYQNSYAEPTNGTTTHPPTASTNLALDASGNFFFSAAETTATSTSTVCCTIKVNLANTTLTELDSPNASPGTNFIAINSNTQWVTGNGNTLSYIGSTNKSLSGGGLNGARGVALDSSGNAWIANATGNSLSEFNSTGSAVTGTSGYTGGGLATPTAIAIDGVGTVWATNSSGSYGLSQFSSAGAAIGSGYASPGLSNAGGMVVDASGNLWVADASSTTVLQYLGIAAPVVTPMASAISSPGTRP